MSHQVFNDKTFLVTGAAGFVGSHLTELLLGLGAKVMGFDNLVTGSEENLESFQDHSSFTFTKADVSESLPKVTDSLDGIFHLASPASPIDYYQLPIQTLKAGSYAGHQLLELAREKDCRILMASTSEVYGDPLVHPQKETYWGNVNPVGPRSCYDEAKRYLEAVTMTYRKVYEMETRIVRIFNTYGPRMRLNDGRVVPNFISQALQNQPLTIYGTGQQTRSFCYVDDLVQGILAAFASDCSEPINLGNPVEFQIIDFAKKVRELVGGSSEFEYQPLPQDDPKQRKPNISLAKEVLDWQPTIDLNEGLKRTIDYFAPRLSQHKQAV